MNYKTKCLISGVSGLLFIIMIVLVKTVDVQPIGPAETEIGLATINGGVFNLLGTNKLFYMLTKLIGGGAILVALLFGICGLIQLVKRRSLMKVDGAILALGDLYIVLAGLYVLFEVVVINYRPVLEDGLDFPEASFPSSHTMLACVILGSAIIMIGKYVGKKKVRNIAQIVCMALIVVMVAGRLLSGVHWFTDIVAGVLISICLVSLYSAIVDKME